MIVDKEEFGHRIVVRLIVPCPHCNEAVLVKAEGRDKVYCGACAKVFMTSARKPDSDMGLDPEKYMAVRRSWEGE